MGWTGVDSYNLFGLDKKARYAVARTFIGEWLAICFLWKNYFIETFSVETLIVNQPLPGRMLAALTGLLGGYVISGDDIIEVLLEASLRGLHIQLKRQTCILCF